jgi:2-oxoglutarate dehydrogenase E2 component (dihydrolipoamide succinyltransferase)
MPAVASVGSGYDQVKVTPLAARMMEENGLSVEDVIQGLRRLRGEDVEAVRASGAMGGPSGLRQPASRESRSERMSSLRRKLSERLVSVKNETAMLTTFNEVDMKPIMDLRKRHQSAFVEKHGIKLGIMSFFMKACSVALKEFPNVNAMLDGENLVTYDYADISVAVSTPKGLMVPVIRNVESLTLAEIEKAIADMAGKARMGKLSIPEMTGGTFTITNGGIFGSMMSTPLINPPQSAILGMHNILDRPVAMDGQVVIRPMMYVALSYDHRVIDGKDSVGFLVRVKRLLESPLEMLFSGSSGEKALLDL